MRVSRAAWLVAAALASFVGLSRGSEEVDAVAPGSAAEGLYFFVSNKGPEKCFVIRQGKGSIFHVHYKFPEADGGAKIKLEMRSLPEKGPKQARFKGTLEGEKTLQELEGTHQFKIKADGMYSLCAVTKSQSTGRGLRLSLDFDTGKQDSMYDRVKKEYNLNDAQISMIRLKNQAEQMLVEADFMQDIETDYHKTTLRLNREVIWWPITQVVILLITGFYQVRHLKQFFQAKRLV